MPTFVPDYTDREIFEAYEEIFNTTSGQIVLEDLKNACHYHSPLLANGLPVHDAEHLIFFAEGERNVLLRILTILKSKGSDYV